MKYIKTTLDTSANDKCEKKIFLFFKCEQCSGIIPADQMFFRALMQLMRYMQCFNDFFKKYVECRYKLVPSTLVLIRCYLDLC